FFFSSRRRHTRSKRDWSSDVCSSDLQKKTPDPLFSCPAESKSRMKRGSGVFFWGEAKRLPTPVVSPAPSMSAGPRSRPCKARRRSEERRVGKEGKSRWTPEH